MREEKIAEAHRLRAQGLSYSQIGGRLGVVKSTAVKWINPEMAREANRRDNARRAAAKRAWENEHDRPLCRCGNRMTIGAHRKGQTRCAECRARDDREHTQARRERIAGLWNDGATAREIATALDSTTGSVRFTIHHMRRDGWELPYRNAGYQNTVAS